jgi:sRNA-binding regulator protein Hfq
MSPPRQQRPTLGPTASLQQRGSARGPATTPGHAEAIFLAKQVERRAPLTVRLRDGEELVGVLEWYDRSSLRLNLTGGGHRVIQKTAISTIAKAD